MNSGVISAGCAAGSFTSCGTPLTDNGFFSRLVVDSATGKQYFQTIVTMPNATAATPADLEKLDFSDENLVSYSNNSGILDKQRVFQKEVLPVPLAGTHEVNFRNGSVIGTGWAKDFVELTQTITDPVATGGDGFQTDFIYKQVGYSDEPNGKFATGKGMKITSYVPILTTPTINDRQDFVLVEKQGDFVTADGGVTLAPVPGVPPRGGALTWLGDTVPGANTGVRGDRIQALWIGEKLDIAGQQFGYSGYTKWNPPTAPTGTTVSTFSLSDTTATGWSVPTWGSLSTVGTITDPFPVVP